MSGEGFEGQDAGYEPENLTFPQNHSDEHDVENVFDESGYPPPQPDESFDGHDAGNLAEAPNSPANDFGGHDVGDLPQNLDSAQEHYEENHGVGHVPENVGSPQKQGPNVESKGNEIKKWPGWPGKNVYRMLVPAQKVGSIIGRKGEFIKKITEETKARIKILDGPPGTSERALMVSAKEEPDHPIPPAVEGLLRVHRQIVNVDCDPADGTSDQLPVFALQDDSIVEIQDEAVGVRKAVELIASNPRKFLVDRSIVGVFETQISPLFGLFLELKGVLAELRMHLNEFFVDEIRCVVMQMPGARVNHNVPPPHQTWGPPPPQGFPAPAGGGSAFAPNHQYMPPSHHYDNCYPTADLPPVDKHLHQGPRRDAPIGIHSGSAQPQQSVVTKVTLHVQIPLSYADAVIGTSGSNISYMRRASGSSITIQETRGMAGEMTVKISGTASQIQTAQQLVQNFMAEAASSTQDHMGASISQGYNSYPANATVYASPSSSAAGHTGHAPADYGTNFGY